VLFAENNAVLQIHQLFSRIHVAVAERPSVIVVQSVTGEGLERVARNAVASGIGWILLNRRVGYVEELRRTHPELPIALVTPDQVEIGRIQGRQAQALVPDGGLLLYVARPTPRPRRTGSAAVRSCSGRRRSSERC
jgi:ABC-type sugar transport system substrate-binding protein